MCQKIPYDTKGAAVEHANYMLAQARHFSKKYGKAKKSGRKLRPYDCRFCPSWHLTTLKK